MKDDEAKDSTMPALAPEMGERGIDAPFVFERPINYLVKWSGAALLGRRIRMKA